MARELEAKFAVASLEAVRQYLAGLGAKPGARRFEGNIVFDTPGRDLRARGELLRLRESGRAVLTWKRPAGGVMTPGVKAMEEVETVVEDFQAMREILLGLGYVEALRYEKVRETWRLPRAKVCLDHLPFGEFVEIEGDPEAIAEAAGLLGLDMADAKALTYHDLFQEHLARLGLPPADSFVFPEADRERLRGSFLASEF